MKRILALLLVLFTVLSAAACVPVVDDGPEDTGVFVPNRSYNVTLPEAYSECKELTDASVNIRRAFKAVWGIQCTAYNKAEEGQPQILIGDTGAEESGAAMAGLGIDDYRYEIVSKNLIVIAGGSLSATAEGVSAFCREVLLYDGQASEVNIQLTVGTSFATSESYSYDSLTVNGVELGDITVAVSKYTEITFIESLIRGFGQYTGEHIRVCTYEELRGDEPGVICIGATDRAGKKLTGMALDSYKLTFTEEDGGFTATICAAGRDGYKAAIEDFLSAAQLSGNNGVKTVAYADMQKLRCVEFDALDEWQLLDTETENVADGVVYIHYSYKDSEGKPYEVYTLELDPTKVDFYMGSGGDSYEYIPTKKETVNSQISSAIKNGQTVYAGVNGDFFRINSDYSPQGLTIKEGVLINENTAGRGYVGFTADGKCIIDDKLYATSGYSFKTAVGGNQILLRNGLPYNTGTDDEFSLTPHPRTLVGVREDGTVLLVVIDGRQPSISNGAPLKRCAKIMFDLGATSALNIDGGGSSTMCTVNSEGKISTRNSPSDIILRRVYNSILVVKREQ